MVYILYNPLANNGKGEETAYKCDEKSTYLDITKTELSELFASVKKDDRVVICGGDGTINVFANKVQGIEIPKIEYYATGSGNDFLADVADKAEGGLVHLNPYIQNLPTVTVNGETRVFLNGIGYGIDGYCCQVGDEIRAKSTQKINYTSIAIKGLLFYFKRANAKVTVDGKEYNFKKVWLAPTMNGKFYGGGMMIAPNQDRLNKDGKVTCVIMHGSGKLKTLMVFPSIFKGEHVKHPEMCEFLEGHEISVKFEKPCALQIDGETILNVTEYSVSASNRKN